jgi:anti-sigma B factor antagonist
VPDHLQITIEEAGSAHVVKLRGDLDLGSADDLRARLNDVELDGKPEVVVDLRDLAFLDSSGLRELIVASRSAATIGRRFALIAGRDEIQRVFKISGTAERFEWVDPWDLG